MLPIITATVGQVIPLRCGAIGGRYYALMTRLSRTPHAICRGSNLVIDMGARVCYQLAAYRHADGSRAT